MDTAILYILIAVGAAGTGQVVLKHGMTMIGPVTLSSDRLLFTLWRMGTAPFVIVGLLIYVVGEVFWLAALSRVALSYAYPFASLSYVIMLAAGWLLFSESITLLRIAGTLTIGIGVFLVSRS